MNTADTMQIPATKARSPVGCNQHLMTMLTEQERHRVEEVAQLEMRSLSATARMLILRGIEQYNAETEQAGLS